mgnify:CR=1 FL=1
MDLETSCIKPLKVIEKGNCVRATSVFLCPYMTHTSILFRRPIKGRKYHFGPQMFIFAKKVLSEKLE